VCRFLKRRRIQPIIPARLLELTIGWLGNFRRLRPAHPQTGFENGFWSHVVAALRARLEEESDAYVPEKDFRWNVAVALRNADTALVDAVNQALDTLAADGTIPTILGRYGITYRKPVPR
jgi:Bacterial extracellular solute-binding proteins, family 3